MTRQPGRAQGYATSPFAAGSSFGEHSKQHTMSSGVLIHFLIFFVSEKPCKLSNSWQRSANRRTIMQVAPGLLAATILGCFDAKAWHRAHSATEGFHHFSQGYQDSALLSLSAHGLISNTSATYVEFGFHTKDVAGTATQPQKRKARSPRHLLPGELPAYGANTELLRRRGWSGVRFDADEESRRVIPDLHTVFRGGLSVLIQGGTRSHLA